MEQQELIIKYELVIIVDVKLSADEKKSISKEAAEAVNRGGGKILNSQVWLEKHKFTFRIKKSQEGTYYLINFEGPGSVIEKIRPILRLNEKILRFTIMKVAAHTMVGASV